MRPTAPPARRPRGGRGPPFRVDVEDRGDEFRVVADLPGLRRQDLDVRVRGSRLQIVADFGAATPDGRPLRREREHREVSRVVRLPERVDERHVTASYVAGVLRVHLRKRRRPRRIPVE